MDNHMKKPSRKILDRLHWSQWSYFECNLSKKMMRKKAYGDRVRKLALAYLEQLKSADIKIHNQ